MKSIKLPGGNRVKVIFHESLGAWRRKIPAAHDAWGLAECYTEAPDIVTIHIPLPSSVSTVVHEAVHAAIHSARFRGLRGEAREEEICNDAGLIASRILTEWRKRHARN
jgi:hypothetical protein